MNKVIITRSELKEYTTDADMNIETEENKEKPRLTDDELLPFIVLLNKVIAA